MVQADNDRVAALAGHSGVRRYRFDNQKPNNRCPAQLILADMTGITNADPSDIDLLYRMRESGARLTAALPPLAEATTTRTMFAGIAKPMPCEPPERE